MIESMRAAFTLPDLRRRILYTIGMLLLLIPLLRLRRHCR